ncbi:MAG: UvrB/UvrC motif-containing protein [Gemmataceae bacterium]
MSGLYPERIFAGFGPSQLDPSPSPTTAVTARSTRQLRLRVRRSCPHQPGVYGMIDARRKLIYVGKAKSLRSRLMSYFRPASRDAKAGRIIQRARAIVWEPAAGEFAALLRELELIRRWRPIYNVQGQPGGRRACYICVGRKPAPYLFVARIPPTGILGCFGPLPNAARAGEAVRRLNDLFRLRDCDQSTRMHFADQPDLFPVERPVGCLRAEIGTCSGPCAAGTSRASYSRQVRAARAFLDGTDDAILHRLQREMENAAAALAFERAAVARDRLEAVQWLSDKLAWLQRARREYTFVYPLAADDGRSLWYLVRGGRVVRGVVAPRDARTRIVAYNALHECFGSDSPIPIGPDQIDSVLLVAAWFKRNPAERLQTLTPEQAIVRCQSTRAIVR